MNAIDLNRRAISATVATSLLGVATASCANMAIDELPYAKTAPFTAQEFWQRISDLINEKAGLPSRERVERALGTRFDRDVGDQENQVLFMDYGKHWYFDARLKLDKVQPSLSIWTPITKNLAFSDGLLQWSPYVNTALLNSGWGRAIANAHFDPIKQGYKKDRVALSLSVVRNMVQGLTVAWIL